MRHACNFLVASCALIVSGCTPSADAERIEKNLGDYRFQGITPALKIQILQQKVIPPDSSRSWAKPKLQITGIVQQTADFPVKTYQIRADISPKIKGAKVSQYDFFIQTTITNGSGAFTEERELDKIAHTPNSDEIELDLVEFNWWPVREFRSSVQIEVQRK